MNEYTVVEAIDSAVEAIDSHLNGSKLDNSIIYISEAQLLAFRSCLSEM